MNIKLSSAVLFGGSFKRRKLLLLCGLNSINESRPNSRLLYNYVKPGLNMATFGFLDHGFLFLTPSKILLKNCVAHCFLGRQNVTS